MQVNSDFMIFNKVWYERMKLWQIGRAIALGIWAGSAFGTSLVTAADPLIDTKVVDFSREIQPLFAKRCFACHGPNTQEGGLRLDEHAGALQELDSGSRAIVANDPATSVILERITSSDPQQQMPPEGSRLTIEQIDSVKAWIVQGAPWKEHWAFRSISRPEVPREKQGELLSNPIDGFVLKGLYDAGMSQPPPAEKTALLRRATFDVTGLPPTQAQLDEFLADDSAGAWEKVVDRLLASEHYGERWARHWLDLVRYADTNSFERDGKKPHSWRYRDYVIRSLNEDKPFDRFVLEQLAGDELPDKTSETMIATGYYRLGVWDDEPADRLLAKYDALDDIVATTGQVFLGLTVNCARCHDHKIDPIPQKDYYSLLSFFHNITPMAGGGPHIEQPLFDSDQARLSYAKSVADLEQRRNVAQANVTAIESDFSLQWKLENPDVDAAGNDLDDLRYRYYRDSWKSLPVFDELKPESQGKLPGQLFDTSPTTRDTNYGFVYEGFLKVPEDGEYEFSLDSDDGSRLKIADQFILQHDGIHGEGSPKTSTMSLKSGRVPVRLEYFQALFGRGLSVSWKGPGFSRRSLSVTAGNGGEKKSRHDHKAIAEAIQKNGERILGKENFERYTKSVKNLESLKQEHVPVDMALVISEHGPQPPDTFVFYRGNPQSPRDKVEPAFPSILKAPLPDPIPASENAAEPSKSSGRRTQLARWLVSRENPLTARVTVNRLWQHHFGRGIVRSSNNFGMMGDPPTHPELLDWLASELVFQNWKLKPIHKLILMSKTYRASSEVNAEAFSKDPLNDRLWRFDMRRLSAEELRDSIHSASGVLNSKMFGPGIFSTISKEVLAGQSVPGSGWGDSSPEEQARRSIYIHVKRSLITPLLADFDFADTDSSCPVRFATTQPTQALGMINGAFTHNQATVFAARLRREAGGDLRAQVRMALEVALSKKIDDPSVERGMRLIEELQAGKNIDEHRAVELYCLMIFNLNEFSYLD